MSHIQKNEESGAVPTMAVLRCRKCREAMHLTSIEPHVRFQNIDAQNFTCDGCGSTESFLVARMD